jgi:hypothetical protein
VSKEQLHAIVDQCMAEANARGNANAPSEDCSEARNWSDCYLRQQQQHQQQQQQQLQQQQQTDGNR